MDIAEHCSISVKTVSSYILRAKEKMGVCNTVLVALAWDRRFRAAGGGQAEYGQALASILTAAEAQWRQFILRAAGGDQRAAFYAGFHSAISASLEQAALSAEGSM
jgi:hypothetical protein